MNMQVTDRPRHLTLLDFAKEEQRQGYTACDLHGLRAVMFGDGTMMLGHESATLHLTAKQVDSLQAFLMFRQRKEGP